MYSGQSVFSFNSPTFVDPSLDNLDVLTSNDLKHSHVISLASPEIELTIDIIEKLKSEAVTCFKKSESCEIVAVPRKFNARILQNRKTYDAMKVSTDEQGDLKRKLFLESLDWRNIKTEKMEPNLPFNVKEQFEERISYRKINFKVLATSIFKNLHKESFGASLPDTLNGTNIHNYYLTTEIPKRYLKNSPQPETSFLYLPESVKTTKCQKIESQSIYLIKTARNAAFERFKIRRNFLGDGFIFNHQNTSKHELFSVQKNFKI